MPSSVRVSAAEPTASPSIPANGERPRWTESAQSVPPMKPTKLAATIGSRTTGQVREDGLVAPRREAAVPWLQGGAPPPVDPLDSLACLRVLEAARSAAAGCSAIELEGA